MVYNKAYESNDADVVDTSKNLSQVIRDKMHQNGRRFWAGDNISEYITPATKSALIDEATAAFEKVLDALLIDRETDPNSRGTARRLAKMYYNEIMAGRYEPAPDATAFPNDSADRYEGMLVVRSELRSMCSHHHQPVSKCPHLNDAEGKKIAQKMIQVADLTRSGLANGDISTVMSPRTVMTWADNYKIFNDIGYSFRISFLNRCDELERTIIGEYFQRCFAKELTETSASVKINLKNGK